MLKLLMISFLAASTLGAMQQPPLRCAEKFSLRLQSRQGFDCVMCTGVTGECAIAGTAFYCAHNLAYPGTVCAAGPCVAGVCALGWTYYIARLWQRDRGAVSTYEELVRERMGYNQQPPAVQEMV